MGPVTGADVGDAVCVGLTLETVGVGAVVGAGVRAPGEDARDEITFNSGNFSPQSPLKSSKLISQVITPPSPLALI